MSEDTREKIQYFLDRFYTSRIGIRLLINQHSKYIILKLSSMKNSKTLSKTNFLVLLFGDSPIRQPNLYGSIDPKCDVGNSVEDAFLTAKVLCEQYYLGAPEMDLQVYNGKYYTKLSFF